MSIDERLEKLRERHEALSQSLKELAREQASTDKQLKRLGAYIRGMLRRSA